MKEVYFYKGTELKYSVYSNSLEDVTKTPANYYAEYAEDMVITDIKYQNPIFANNELREMTREEQLFAGLEISLEEGEIIKRKKIIKIEKPSQWHTWNGTEWIVDLEELREIKREEFKQERDRKQNDLLEFKGNLYQVDYVKDFKNIDLIQAKLVRLRLRGLDTTEYLKEKIKWTLANNEDIELTLSDVLDLADAYTDRYQFIHHTCNQVLYPKILAAGTAEEIMNLKWE